MSTDVKAVRFLAAAFADLADAWNEVDYVRSFLRELGWAFESVPAELAAIGAPASVLATAWHRVAYNEPTIEQLAELVEAIRTLWFAIRQLDSMTDPPELAGADLASELARDIFDYCLVEALDRDGWFTLPLLELLGVIEVRYVEELLPRRAYSRRRIHWDRIPTLLSDPVAVFGAGFGWGTNAFDADRVLSKIRRLLTSLRWSVALSAAPLNEVIAAGGVDSDRSPGVDLQFYGSEGPNGESINAGVGFLPIVPNESPSGLALVPYATPGLSAGFQIDDHVSISIDSTFDIQGGVVLSWLPTSGLRLITDLENGGTATATGQSIFRLQIDDPDKEEKRLLDALGFQLIARTAQGLARLDVGTESEFAIEAEIKDGIIRWDTSQAPGVLATVLGSRQIEASAVIAVGWSNRRGFYLRGGGSLGTVIPATVQIGPLALRAVRVALEPLTDGLGVKVGFDGSFTLGPVSLTWEGFGLRAGVRRGGPAEPPIDFDLGLSEPSLIGLSIDAAAVVGGGAVARSASGGYSGFLALQALGVTLSALGILDKASSGAYSLVAAVSGTFSPIQLGLGFTLNGVGGLIGINRRVNFDALRAALRGPGIGDIFFATDPAAQAARMLGDLATYFPAAEGRYVFGPAAKIGWGTPTIVEADIALLFEVPSPVRIFLVGSVHTALPTKAKPIVALRVDVLGELDLANKRLAIDASLRDSKVAGFPLTGDMALRMSWGSPPSFVLSVGGFHSQFRPPPGFPALRRVQILIGADDNPRLDVQGFLALTSNTAQIGAQVELYAAAGPLNIKGTLGFEALFQFSPFSFRVDLWAGVALRRGKTTLASVHFDGTLTGPTPWKIAGEACLSLWIIDLCVDFEATFGQKEATELPEREIWPLLEAALEAPASWGTELPPAAARAVTTAPPVGEASQTLIDPVAALTVRQKVAPLNREITRFGQTAPAGANRFNVTQVKVGAVPAAFVPVTEWFAPAQFEDLEDADRMARSGFEEMDAGVTISSAAVTAGSVLITALDYETVVIQSGARNQGPNFRPTVLAQIAGTARSAAAGAGLRSPAPPVPRVRLDEERFVVASTHDLAPRLDIAAAASRGAVALALAAFLRDNPAERGSVEVVPMHEAAA